MEDKEQRIRDELSTGNLLLTKDRRSFRGRSFIRSFMFDNINSYVALSQDNTRKCLVLYPFDSDPGNYEFWDKVGQMVGNLMELMLIIIKIVTDPVPPYPDDDDDNDDDRDEARIPDWETLTRILPHLRQQVSLTLTGEGYDPYAGEVEEIQGLARAIHGHPMISALDFHPVRFTFTNFGPWCSALAIWPSGARNRRRGRFAKPRAFEGAAADACFAIRQIQWLLFHQ
jgi:hypothetical protein